MTKQEAQSFAFLAANLVTCGTFVSVVLGAFGGRLWGISGSREFWAWTIIGFIVLQMIVRFGVFIVIAIAQKRKGSGEPIDLEDELDKTIDRQSSLIAYRFVLAGTVVGIATQAMSMPFEVLFAAIGSAMAIGGIVGDCVRVFRYRRGF